MGVRGRGSDAQQGGVLTITVHEASHETQSKTLQNTVLPIEASKFALVPAHLMPPHFGKRALPRNEIQAGVDMWR